MRSLILFFLLTTTAACTAIASVEDHDSNAESDRYYSHEVDTKAMEPAPDGSLSDRMVANPGQDDANEPAEATSPSDAGSIVDVAADVACSISGQSYAFDASPYECPAIHPRELAASYAAVADNQKCFDYDARVRGCWIYCCNTDF